MDKHTAYEAAWDELQRRTEGERDLIANLANASAILNEFLEEINWVGFYLLHGEELVLGPFQGRPACVRIAVGRGVCGTAFREDRVLRVEDVHQFLGHIACDQRSRSEVVVPIHHRGRPVAVLDIDSPVLRRFDEADQRALEALAAHLETCCDWT